MLTMRSLKSIDFYITHTRRSHRLTLRCLVLLLLSYSLYRSLAIAHALHFLPSASCTPRHRHHQGKTKSREKTYPNRYSNLSDELSAYKNNNNNGSNNFILSVQTTHTPRDTSGWCIKVEFERKTEQGRVTEREKVNKKIQTWWTYLIYR